jgi:hypothetical protein
MIPSITVTRAQYNQIKQLTEQIARLEREQEKLFCAACLIAGVDSEDTVESGPLFDYMYNGDKNSLKIERRITGIGGAK